MPTPSDSHDSRRVMTAFVDKHRLLQNVLQLTLVVASNYLAFWLRFDGEIPPLYWSVFIYTIGWLVASRAAAFARFGLFTGLWQYAGIFDVTNVIAAVGLSSAASYVSFMYFWDSLTRNRSSSSIRRCSCLACAASDCSRASPACGGTRVVAGARKGSSAC